MAELSREICTRLQEFLRIEVPKGSFSRLERFKLSFTFDEKEYTTTFKVMIFPGSSITIFNNCLKVDISSNILEESAISANTKEEPCFEPRLVSDPRNKPGLRVSVTDILQTLKTKLAFCVSPDIDSIPLVDEATIDKIEISKFNILRGEPAIYEKYGYRSEDMDKFKKIINGLTWGTLDDDMKQTITDFIHESIDVESQPLSFEPDRPLTDIMKMISFEYEKNYSGYDSPSSIIFNTYDTDMSMNIHNYTLNKEEPRWKSWDSRLLFTGFEIIKSAGSRGRTQRKSMRRRANTKRRRHRVRYSRGR